MNNALWQLTAFILIFPGLSSGDTNWSRITQNNETCWYRFHGKEMEKRCQEADPNHEAQLPGTPALFESKPRQTQSIKPPTPNPFLGIITNGLEHASKTVANNLTPIPPVASHTQDAKSPSPAMGNDPNTSQLTAFPLFWILLALSGGYFLGNARKKRSEDYIQHEAELLVKEELRKLDSNHYCVMHDITLPTAEGTTQIDHIVFSERGLFVIETKSHQGWLYGRENDARWKQVFRGTKKYDFHNPLIQNANHIKHIDRLIPLPAGTTQNIVVFTHPTVEIKTPLPTNVIKLTGLQAYINQFTQPVISRQRLHEIIGCIEFKRKERSHQTNNDHIAFVKRRFGRSKHRNG